MPKQIFDVSVWVETSDEELQIFQESFKWDPEIDFLFHKNIYRFSWDELGWIIDIVLPGLAVNGIYDLLKLAVVKILSHDFKRRWAVSILIKNKRVILSKDHYMMQENTTQITFDSVDDIFEYIQKQ